MPTMPQRSGSSPNRSAYARMHASTASTWRRRLSEAVHSQKSAQASSRVIGSVMSGSLA